MSTFARFEPRLQQAIVSRLGWSALRPVQEEAGATLLDGHNAVILAPTAGGKTEASLFPVLSQLMRVGAEGLGAIYIAPIKALLNNQAERLGTYTEMVGLRRFVWHGDVRHADKRRFVREPVELLMTTPESLEVMLISPRVPVARLMAELRFIVIDEIHALAGTDRGAHLMSVLERLAVLSKHDVQRIGLSATVGNPEAILTWLTGTSRREGRVVDPPKPAARRELLVLQRDQLTDVARDAARMAAAQKSLFFCQSRSTTEAVAERMRGTGIDVFVHHSSVSTEDRHAAEERFHAGTNACIVCTSTLELGIDVGDLDRVFQSDAPSTVSSFLQRMGRTGRRADQAANMTFLCETPTSVVHAVALVELAREGWVEAVEPNGRCWPVLIHQLMAMALQFGAIRAEPAWEQLRAVPDFADITRLEFEALLAHLVETEFLFDSEGALHLGDEAERVFGRRNFMELYAVFSSPVLYRVQTEPGHELGSLEQAFVDTLVEEMSSFLLGGRAWMLLSVDHRRRRVTVRPAPRGRRPSWGGFLPQMLGGELCQKMRAVLADTKVYPYLHRSAAEALESARNEHGPVACGAVPEVQMSEGQVMWWTFAGGRANHTLKHALEMLRGWRCRFDNFFVEVAGDGLDEAAWTEALVQLREPGFWDDDAVWTALCDRLPAFRLSKFQQAMPAWAVREMLGKALLDARGTPRRIRPGL